MVWYRESEPPVVPTRWALLEVAHGGAPVWPRWGGRLHGGEHPTASSMLPDSEIPVIVFDAYIIRKYHNSSIYILD